MHLCDSSSKDQLLESDWGLCTVFLRETFLCKDGSRDKNEGTVMWNLATQQDGLPSFTPGPWELSCEALA